MSILSKMAKNLLMKAIKIVTFNYFGKSAEIMKIEDLPDKQNNQNIKNQGNNQSFDMIGFFSSEQEEIYPEKYENQGLMALVVNELQSFSPTTLQIIQGKKIEDNGPIEYENVIKNHQHQGLCNYMQNKPLLFAEYSDQSQEIYSMEQEPTMQAFLFQQNSSILQQNGRISLNNSQIYQTSHNSQSISSQQNEVNYANKTFPSKFNDRVSGKIAHSNNHSLEFGSN